MHYEPMRSNEDTLKSQTKRGAQNYQRNIVFKYFTNKKNCQNTVKTPH